MVRSLWFNARVLCCEVEPRYSKQLQALRARVSWAPLNDPQEDSGLRRLDGDWADPDFPYRAVEGHEVVLVRWPQGPSPAEYVRWWASSALHLFESARRYRVRALGLGLAAESTALNRAAGQFLAEYLEALELPHFLARAEDQLLQELHRALQGDDA